jgi:hypothetical protein
MLARELLGIAVTNLAYAGEDPESVLADGPVLDIARNVAKALENCPSEMPLGNKPE